jgi:hypothetical protein
VGIETMRPQATRSSAADPAYPRIGRAYLPTSVALRFTPAQTSSRMKMTALGE